jgi:hypothetical protein
MPARRHAAKNAASRTSSGATVTMRTTSANGASRA